MKAFAGRPRDWEDIKGVLSRHRRKLDIAYIWRQLDPLLEALENGESGQRLASLIKEFHS